MTDKEKDLEQLASDQETLDLEKAKEMTVGEAVRKQEDLQAGITEADGLLDRYIKQHREDIEAEKFDTKLLQGLDQEVQAAVEGSPVEPPVEPLVEESIPVQAAEVGDLGIHKHTPPVSTPEVDSQEPNPMPVESSSSDSLLSEESEWAPAPSRKGKMVLWSIFGIILAAALGTALVWFYRSQTQSAATPSTSSSNRTSSSTQSSSSSSAADAEKAFNDLYASFFTDGTHSKLKNESFGQLSELKKALEKMDSSSSAYQTAKKQYDELEKAIQSVEALNQSFDKPVIVDGVVDTTVRVKDGANLEATTSGLTSVDELVQSAVNFGKSQQNANATTTAQEAGSAPATPTGGTSAPATAAPTPSVPAAPAPAAPSMPIGTQPAIGTAQTGISRTGVAAIDQIPFYYTGYGIAVPSGVMLERGKSRVPFNQAMIEDAANAAWRFNPGVIERIVSISKERGYLKGGNYILERINIIKGNGYYNMYRADGTYLFTINAKTGYFVGNGKGHSDKLDYE